MHDARASAQVDHMNAYRRRYGSLRASFFSSSSQTLATPTFSLGVRDCFSYIFQHFAIASRESDSSFDIGPDHQTAATTKAKIESAIQIHTLTLSDSNGAPQWGQTRALSLRAFPHSLQFKSAMALIPLIEVGGSLVTIP